MRGLCTAVFIFIFALAYAPIQSHAKGGLDPLSEQEEKTQPPKENSPSDKNNPGKHDEDKKSPVRDRATTDFDKDKLSKQIAELYPVSNEKAPGQDKSRAMKAVDRINSKEVKDGGWELAELNGSLSKAQLLRALQAAEEGRKAGGSEATKTHYLRMFCATKFESEMYGTLSKFESAKLDKAELWPQECRGTELEAFRTEYVKQRKDKHLANADFDKASEKMNRILGDVKKSLDVLNSNDAKEADKTKAKENLAKSKTEWDATRKDLVDKDFADQAAAFQRFNAKDDPTRAGEAVRNFAFLDDQGRLWYHLQTAEDKGASKVAVLAGDAKQGNEGVLASAAGLAKAFQENERPFEKDGHRNDAYFVPKDRIEPKERYYAHAKENNGSEFKRIAATKDEIVKWPTPQNLMKSKVDPRPIPPPADRPSPPDEGNKDKGNKQEQTSTMEPKAYQDTMNHLATKTCTECHSGGPGSSKIEWKETEKNLLYIKDGKASSVAEKLFTGKMHPRMEKFFKEKTSLRDEDRAALIQWRRSLGPSMQNARFPFELPQGRNLALPREHWFAYMPEPRSHGAYSSFEQPVLRKPEPSTIYLASSRRTSESRLSVS